jgi:hypothetical protein
VERNCPAIRSRARSTPASPPAIRPYRYARPSTPASAPRAIAVSTSAPCLIPESTTKATEGPTASRTGAIRSTVATARSSCRPPWLDSQMPSTPSSAARSASAGPSGPLSSSFPAHRARSAAMSDQFRSASKKSADPITVVKGRPAKLA